MWLCGLGSETAGWGDALRCPGSRRALASDRPRRGGLTEEWLERESGAEEASVSELLPSLRPCDPFDDAQDNDLLPVEERPAELAELPRGPRPGSLDLAVAVPHCPDSAPLESASSQLSSLGVSESCSAEHRLRRRRCHLSKPALFRRRPNGVTGGPLAGSGRMERERGAPLPPDQLARGRKGLSRQSLVQQATALRHQLLLLRRQAHRVASDQFQERAVLPVPFLD